MAALSLRGTTDPARAARALEIRSHTIAEYFVSEVLDQQPPEIVWFMLDTSVLGELTADACAAVTARPDAAALLHGIDEAHLFLVALDDERASFRYHHLVRQVLRLSCGPGTGPASRRSSCGQRNGSRPPATHGARALAWFEAGRLPEAADAAGAAHADARRLGFDQHFFAVDSLRVLAGIALERRDLDTAEQLTEQALSITEQRRPIFEFLALLDRAGIWAARGQAREALATVEAARLVLAAAGPELLARADELEASLRLSLGDLRAPAELASRLPAARRGPLLARIALAAGDHHTAQDHLQVPALGHLTPRRALMRQVLLAAAAIERGDPMAASILGGALQTARRSRFVNTVVTAAPQVTSYLITDSAQARADPFTEQLLAAALEAHAAHPAISRSHRMLVEPLTAAELRVVKLLPTSSYAQIAATLYVSRNTVKTHLPVYLPEARGSVPLRGPPAGSRPASALRPPCGAHRESPQRAALPGRLEGAGNEPGSPQAG